MVEINPEMTAGDLVTLVTLCDRAGMEVWLDGGWAVDAVLGRQTRVHKDLDIIVRLSDLTRLIELLGALGFEIKEGGTESNFVLANRSGLEIDVHAIVFDGAGNGVYRMANGLDWVFPAEGFSGRGVVLDTVVRCLSPEVQVLCHANGYTPTEKDFQDMELLQAHFGVELPPQLRRSKP
jgi:lincosamide nucleotidyltransferase A/C/D/E